LGPDLNVIRGRDRRQVRELVDDAHSGTSCSLVEQVPSGSKDTLVLVTVHSWSMPARSLRARIVVLISRSGRKRWVSSSFDVTAVASASLRRVIRSRAD